MRSALSAAFAFALATSFAALPLQAQTAPATLTVQADKPLHAVSPQLYGLMTEEINYSYDGGLYAEMVRNRAFMDHGFGGIARWNLDNKGTAQSTMSIDATQGPSTALPSSLLWEIGSADSHNAAALLNEGYWGMAVQPSTAYQGSLYARADAGMGPLQVSLVSNTTGQTLASATVPEPSAGWQQYRFTLQTAANVTPSSMNHLLISVSHPGKLWLQLVSLMPPTYKNRANGNRPDLMELMAGMHPKFLRMPGGNYLEGNQIDERFDWKNTLGPLVDRPTHPGPWNYTSTDGMGLLEFLEWTEDLKIDPVLAVYAGYSLKGDHVLSVPALQPFVDDALDEIEFVIGDTSTKWGAVRAKLGHPAPFPLTYVEVGNEDWLDHSGSYEMRYPPFYKAIKAKYPQLQIIATAPLKRADSKADVVDDHYYKRAEEMFAMVHQYDKTDRNGPKIFVGEWATREGFPTTNWGAALGDAAWMTGMERNSDVIVMSAYAPLFVNVNPGGMQWESNLIGYDAAHSYGSPSYYAQSIFAEYLGNEVSTSTLTGGSSRFFYSVTRDTAKGALYVKLVNASTEAQPVHLQVQGTRVGAEATLVTMHANSRRATNSVTEPRSIVPVKSTLKATDNIDHTVPPLTIQVIELHTR